jgi:hypothetical protein
MASKDGIIYASIGSSKVNIAAYEIGTGQRREILAPDAQGVGFARVYRSADGSTYGAVGKREFLLSQWAATELESGHTVPAAARNALRDARTLSLSNNNGILALTVTNPPTHTKVEHEIAYQGQKLPPIQDRLRAGQPALWQFHAARCFHQIRSQAASIGRNR